MPDTATERFQFMGHHGQMLDARLEKPFDGHINSVVLFAHCFTCTKDSHAARRITSALAASGFAVLRFDFTGLGGSDGEFANSGFVSNVEDLVAAANHLRNSISAPAILIGHSLGGAAVIAAAEHILEVKAVVTIGAPFEVDHILHQLGDNLEQIEKSDSVKVSIAGRVFEVGRDFVQQARGQNQGERLAKLGKALLVMHAPGDEIVGIDNASEIFGGAKHPKSFVSLHDADHLLTKKGSANYVANMIAAWSQIYVPNSRDAPNA